MKHFSNLRLKALTLVLSLSTALTFAQNVQETEPIQEEKKKLIKVQCLINDKVAPANVALGRKDIELSLKTFPFYEQDRKDKKELIVKEFDVSLMRDGKKIANQTILGSGSIACLASMARNEDTYLIQIKEVFEKTKDGCLKPYAKGMIKLAYLFYDLEMFKPAQHVNAMSVNDIK